MKANMTVNKQKQNNKQQTTWNVVGQNKAWGTSSSVLHFMVHQR